MSPRGSELLPRAVNRYGGATYARTCKMSIFLIADVVIQYASLPNFTSDNVYTLIFLIDTMHAVVCLAAGMEGFYLGDFMTLDNNVE